MVNTEKFITKSIAEIKTAAGNDKVVMALSGGVDSSVCGVLAARAIGDNLIPIYIDTGLMRKGETERIDSRFLEPACGNGNFLVRILQRKLAAVELKFGKSDFERRHFALLALMCCYGIELLADNIAECR